MVRRTLTGCQKAYELPNWKWEIITADSGWFIEHGCSTSVGGFQLFLEVRDAAFLNCSSTLDAGATSNAPSDATHQIYSSGAMMLQQSTN